MTMHKYTIYCTEEQTKKALELGAPINAMNYYEANEYEDKFDDNTCLYIEEGEYYPIPTAEQMINWLEEQGVYFEIGYMQYFYVEGGKDIFDKLTYEYRISKIGKTQLLSKKISFTSRKEATLAAIDAALAYLTN